MGKTDVADEKEFVLAFGSFINIINTWILGSISEVYDATKDFKSNSTPMVAFILVSTTIDFIAGFFEGITTLDIKNSRCIYINFLKKYMPNYDPENLYKDLRCRLAHNFVVGGSCLLTHKNSALHMKTFSETGQVIINFENLYEDFKKAIKVYIGDLGVDKDLREKFLVRYRLGVPTVVQIKGEV